MTSAKPAANSSLILVEVVVLVLVLCYLKSKRVVTYGSRTIYLHERIYSATRLEMLALVDFIDHFRRQMQGTAGRDENMKVAHHVVRPNMFPQQSCNQARRRRGRPRLQKANFLGMQSKLFRDQRIDPDISPAIARVEEGKPKPSHDELSRLSPISRP